MTGRDKSKSIRPPTYWRHLTACIRGLVTLGLALLLIASAQAAPSKNVLIIQQGPQNSPFATLVVHELQKGLTSDPSVDVLLDVEYWNQWGFGDASRQASAMAIKYAGKKFDLIISSGVAPFELLLDSGSKLFPGVPVLFLNLTDLHKPVNGWPANFTGIVTHIDYAETIKLATKLQPDLNHIYYVLGDSAVDPRSMELVHQELQTFDGKLEVSYWEHDSLGQLLAKAGDLPPHSAILFDEFAKEPDGQTHTPARVCSLLSLSSRVPVYGLYQTMVGNGAVGGVVGSLEAVARRAVEIAISLLQGAKTSAFPVENSQSQVMIDWRQFERFHLTERQLPSSAIVLYRQPTVWQTYKRYIIVGISVCLAETLLIFGLLWQRAKRKNVEKSLVERLAFESLLADLSTTFINLPEPQVYSNIEKSLGRIGEFLEMDRITLFEFSHDGSHLIATSAWGKERISGLLTMMQTEQWRWWTPRALRGEEVLCSNPDILPDEASNERQYLLDSGIQSIASVPLQMGGGSIGCLSFVSKNRQVEWTRDLVRQLTVFAEIFSNALKRKRSEAVLRESEERFRLVANTAPVLIWMSTPDKKCSYFNKPWLDFTGRTLDSELGDGWAQGVHIEDLQKCLATYDHAFDRRHPFKMEYRLRRYDGEYRWIVDIGVPRFNADDSFAGYIGSCLDVTDRKLAAEALAGVSRKLIDAQEKERARIARELHDDINQRLALLAIELQQLAQNPPPTVGEVGGYLYGLSTQVFEIGNDVQAISHSLHSSKLEYLGIVAAANSLCKEFSEQQGVVVDFRHEGIPRMVSPDISLCLFRVLQEALHNAIKHSGVQHFEVEMHGGSNGITLNVSDLGVGFDTETGGDSPGLGLISMRERVSLVDGTISIASKPAHGTVISVRVPVGRDGASPLNLGSKTVGEFEISADLAS